MRSKDPEEGTELCFKQAALEEAYWPKPHQWSQQESVPELFLF